MSAAPTTAVLIDAAATLRLLSCPTCGVAFGMPHELYLRRASDAGTVHCPNGHSIIIAPDAPEELHLLNAYLMGELQQAWHERRQAKGKGVRAKSPEEIRRQEIWRRACVIAAEAKRDGARHYICPICAARVYFNAINRHVEREHASALLAMPRERFEKK